MLERGREGSGEETEIVAEDCGSAVLRQAAASPAKVRLRDYSGFPLHGDHTHTGVCVCSHGRTGLWRHRMFKEGKTETPKEI